MTMFIENIIHVKKAVRADKKIIAALYADCFEEAWTVASVDELFKAKGCWAFILYFQNNKDENVAAGFVLGRSMSDEAEILSLGVNPKYQGEGFAKKLMQHAMGEAKARQGAMLYLEVAEDNHRAYGLYKSLGFDVIGRRKNYYLKTQSSPIDALNLGIGL